MNVGKYTFVEDNLARNDAILLGGKDYTDLLTEGITIFTGGNPENLLYDSHSLSAVSDNGVCVYRDILREPNLDSELLSRVHIIPGRIEFSGKPYMRVNDDFSASWESRNKARPKDFPTFFREVREVNEAKIKVRESFQALHVSFQFEFATSTTLTDWQLGPARLSSMRSVFSAITKCPSHSEPLDGLDGIKLNESIQSLMLDWGEVWLCQGTDLACIAAFGLLDQIVIDQNLRPKKLINNGQCLQCVLGYAKSHLDPGTEHESRFLVMFCPSGLSRCMLSTMIPGH